MKNNLLVLCGFMGSGKTTLGQLAAQQLERRFIDTDHYIERQAGLPVAEIFRLEGEAGFREREHHAVLELCGEGNAVLATGGGALTFARNVDPLRQKGVVVYLNPGFEVCYRRIASSDRPLVRANTRGQLAQLYQARDLLYRKAAHHVLEIDGDKAAWVEGLLALLNI